MDNRTDSEELQDKALDEYKCILLCGKSCTADDSLENITPEKWESIREKSLKWKELDKLRHVHENVDWEKGPKAEKRKQKSEEHLERNEASDQQDPPPEASAPKRLRSSMGVLHDKTLCVWCMKRGYKSSNRDKQILLLSTVDAWTKFKLHTVRLENDVMRLRLYTLIASIPDSQTAFWLEIRYHRSCWRKYVSDHKPLSDESTQHLQRVNLREGLSSHSSHSSSHLQRP
ncbi:hypothetical protein GWK47_034598 [Chionoecetes opilio]|uniref:Uncharacterized protein n=1 Tax=Chionoecetes opilio TaxID=41210 RepID=A0A8J4YI10_CHIOP|nr:hypothetical protein GWK47_034598 [Chionoecetes opilio]